MQASARETALLERLQAALADAEVRRVLAASLLAHDVDGRARLLERLPPDTALALRDALEPPRRGKVAAEVPAGKAKIQEDWAAAWAAWNECVGESCEEDGKYVQQDHHWEAPYFCSETLAADLEVVAKRMKPLVARVRAERLDPTFSFFDQVRRLDGEVGAGLSEYVDDAAIELVLGPEATSRMLEWEHTAGGGTRRDPFAFVDALCRLEVGLRNVSFDRTAVRRFVTAWDEEDQRAVVSGIRRSRHRDHWAKALEPHWSGWFRLAVDLARRWDPPLHAELCISHLAQDWTLAVPVVDDLIRKQDHDQAAAVLAAAFRTMLRSRADDEWDPRSSLIVLRGRLDHESANAAKAERLLRARRMLAELAGETDVVAAIDLQILALRGPEDGKAMVAAFRAMTDARVASVRRQLLSEWSELVAQRTLRSLGASGSEPVGGWVAALVAAAVDGPAATPRLRASVRRALGEAADSLSRPRGGALWSDPLAWLRRGGFLPLARLTLDLDVGAHLKQAAPSLHRLLQQAARTEPSKLDAVRRGWFKRLGGAQLLTDVMGFWRTNVARYVPDPSSCEYGLCVEWLTAARELDRKSGDRILAEWGSAHRLKRNLWAAVRRKGLPVPAGVQVGR